MNLVRHAPRILLAATGLIALGQAHADPLFGQNLIVNGDAEASAGGFGEGSSIIPGFSVQGDSAVVLYSAGGGFPTALDPGPADRGLNFFAGGSSPDGLSSLTQFIDVSAGAATIDSGAARYDLSAYLGGFSSQRDFASLTITFVGDVVPSFGTVTLGPVSNTDRADLTGLLARATSGAVPVGTRFIDVELDMTRLDGSYVDGYADNLSLVLTAAAVPEPTSAALLAAGLGALGFARRRTQRGKSAT